MTGKAIQKYCKNFIRYIILNDNENVNIYCLRCEEHMGKVKPIVSNIFADDSNNELLSDDPDFQDFNHRLKNLPSSAQVNNKPIKKVKSKSSVISNLKALSKSKGNDKSEQSVSGKNLKYSPTSHAINSSDDEFN